MVWRLLLRFHPRFQVPWDEISSLLPQFSFLFIPLSFFPAAQSRSGIMRASEEGSRLRQPGCIHSVSGCLFYVGVSSVRDIARLFHSLDDLCQGGEQKYLNLSVHNITVESVRLYSHAVTYFHHFKALIQVRLILYPVHGVLSLTMRSACISVSWCQAYLQATLKDWGTVTMWRRVQLECQYDGLRDGPCLR
ncbi:uncharacterized protein LOC9637157 isoform X2 [Selaginella moellendorffii]|uniref:uncharacterized protein LOC9637157 isoform X2 n=1 Tax=Selaginella moellendorffii TaxID=88036 RepID=UPI000D1C3F13|nr:uncharacterized protein LOC9637157 isoform X2 [Selaginella moellendorffii]|eukprot:XP_024519152.1 uncharacterized protein LOC9637157 isoform X2 [Selaginella moellendorffii]